jgi:peroxidase
VPTDDVHNKDQRCFVTPRSAAAPRNYRCQMGAREQLNMLTHWLDLSNIYGNNLAASVELRLLSGGELNSSLIRNMKREYLPFKTDGTCMNIPEGKPCFVSGDIRTNQNMPLLSLQTIWMREHNRIAKALAVLNPYWSDEKLFQEARRIAIASYQHILFSEWLPILIGEKVTKLYGLMPLNQDYFYRLEFEFRLMTFLFRFPIQH